MIDKPPNIIKIHKNIASGAVMKKSVLIYSILLALGSFGAQAQTAPLVAPSVQPVPASGAKSIVSGATAVHSVPVSLRNLFLPGQIAGE